MPFPEQDRRVHQEEAPDTDEQVRTEQPRTSRRMEQAIANLAACYGVDLARAGTSFAVNIPQCPQLWLIANIDGDRMGVTRCQVDEDGSLCPDLDMVFAVTPDGWEPQELTHSDQVWHDYAQAMQATGQTLTNQQGDFNFVTFTDYMAQDLEHLTSALT